MKLDDLLLTIENTLFSWTLFIHMKSLYVIVSTCDYYSFPCHRHRLIARDSNLNGCI